MQVINRFLVKLNAYYNLKSMDYLSYFLRKTTTKNTDTMRFRFGSLMGAQS